MNIQVTKEGFEGDLSIVGKSAGAQKTHQWDNYDNRNFYAKMQPKEMQAFAEKGGLSSCCDMEVLKKYWINTSSILEVGAGYGRIVDYLLAHNYKGRIVAIERSTLLFRHLEELYASKVRLLHTDVHNCDDIHETFDLILFAWSGIQDFSPKEQQLVIQDLAKLINPGGQLILDTIPSDAVPLGSETSDRKDVYKLNFNDTAVYIHNVSQEQMSAYSIVAGFKEIEHISYTTDTGRKRVAHILSL